MTLLNKQANGKRFSCDISIPHNNNKWNLIWEIELKKCGYLQWTDNLGSGLWTNHGLWYLNTLALLLGVSTHIPCVASHLLHHFLCSHNLETQAHSLSPMEWLMLADKTSAPKHFLPCAFPAVFAEARLHFRGRNGLVGCLVVSWLHQVDWTLMFAGFVLSVLSGWSCNRGMLLKIQQITFFFLFLRSNAYLLDCPVILVCLVQLLAYGGPTGSLERVWRLPGIVKFKINLNTEVF